MNKFIGHLKTVHAHRKAVRKLCFKCGFYWRGLVHDLSKYSPSEFFPSVKYWTGKRSPIDEEMEQKGYSMAWLHHKAHNKHHYEYWMDPVHRSVNVQMPDQYLVEMFCDRVAAAKTYLKENFTNDAPLKYLHSRPWEAELMNGLTYYSLNKMFEMYAEKGEDFTCASIKEQLKERKGKKIQLDVE